MLRALSFFLIPTVLAGALAFGTTALVSSEPPSTWWVNWGGESFSSRGQLRGWLRAHGHSYRGWAANHPFAAARLEGRDAPAPETRRVPAAKPKPKTPQSTAEPRVAARRLQVAARDRQDASIADSLILLMLVVVAVALVATAALPIPLLRAIRAPDLVDEHRLELATAGVSIAIGMAAAQLLSGH